MSTQSIEREARQMAPWAVGAKQYADRYGDLSQSAARWRLAALTALGVVAVLGLSLAALARAPRVQPYIVQVDQHGFAVPVQPGAAVSSTDERLVIATLGRWVRAHRTVLSDRGAQRALIDETYAFLLRGSGATEQVDGFYRRRYGAEGAVASAAPQQVSVQVERVHRLGEGHTWDVDWQERAERDAEPVRTTRYSARISVQHQSTTTLEDVIDNPLGIYIRELSIRTLAEKK